MLAAETQFGANGEGCRFVSRIVGPATQRLIHLDVLSAHR